MKRTPPAPPAVPNDTNASASAPVRLTDAELALVEPLEHRLEQVTRELGLVLTTSLAARGIRLGTDVRIVGRVGAELALEAIPSPNPAP